MLPKIDVIINIATKEKINAQISETKNLILIPPLICLHSYYTTNNKKLQDVKINFNFSKCSVTIDVRHIIKKRRVNPV
ncbi:hypothetical protein MUSASHINO07_08590 [Gemella sp. Musashino-2025]